MTQLVEIHGAPEPDPEAPFAPKVIFYRQLTDDECAEALFRIMVEAGDPVAVQAGLMQRLQADAQAQVAAQHEATKS